MLRKLIFWIIVTTLTTACPAFAQQEPANTTELSQEGVSLKLDVLTPAKGLITNTTDLLRDKNAAKVLNNLEMLTRGIWTDRGTGNTI